MHGGSRTWFAWRSREGRAHAGRCLENLLSPVAGRLAGFHGVKICCSPLSRSRQLVADQRGLRARPQWPYSSSPDLGVAQQDVRYEPSGSKTGLPEQVFFFSVIWGRGVTLADRGQDLR